MLDNALKKLDDYLLAPSGDAPLVEIDMLLDYLSSQIKDDGGVADFNNPELMCRYSQSGSNIFASTDQLMHQARFFICLSAKYVFAKTNADKKFAENKLRQIINYHCCRVRMHQNYPNAYVFCSAQDDIEHFVDAIYDKIKMFSRYDEFALLIADTSHNEFEETLLRCAYRRKDTDYAHWIIENQFFGRMQTTLFEIICANDVPKAKDVASRFTATCVGWIVSQTCYEPIRSRHGEELAAKEAHIIFESITRKMAEEAKHYLKGLHRDYLLKVHQYLMEKHFSE